MPIWLVAMIVVAAALIGVAWWSRHRPITHVDRYCTIADQEIDGLDPARPMNVEMPDRHQQKAS